MATGRITATNQRHVQKQRKMSYIYTIFRRVFPTMLHCTTCIILLRTRERAARAMGGGRTGERACDEGAAFIIYVRRCVHIRGPEPKMSIKLINLFSRRGGGGA